MTTKYDIDAATPLESIRLTIDLTREADTPDQWTSHCLELDIISAGKTPERALEAVAEAVRLVMDWACEHTGDKTPRDAMVRIAGLIAEHKAKVVEGKVNATSIALGKDR